MTLLFSDKRITETLKSGNEEEINKVFGYLYKTHYKMALQFLKTNSGHESDADDVFQDAMIGLYQNVRKGLYRGDSSVKTYLYSMIRNQWLIRLKENKRSIKMEIPENAVKTRQFSIEENPKEELRKKVNALLEQVGDRCREVLTLYYFDNFSMNEIAQMAHFDNENSAKTQKYKCMQRLITIIAEKPELRKTLSELLDESNN